MKLDISRVRHVVKLANLSISPDEEKKYSEQLSKILGYVEHLNLVSTRLRQGSGGQTSEVEPTFTPVEEISVMRKDETQASLSQSDAFSNAPKQENGQPVGKQCFFVTRGVIKEK